MGDVRESEAIVGEKPSTRANFDGQKEFQENRPLFKLCIGGDDNLPSLSIFNTEKSYSGKNGSVSFDENGTVSIYRNCSKAFYYGPDERESFVWSVGKNQSTLSEIKINETGHTIRFNALSRNWQTFDTNGKLQGQSDFHDATFTVSGVKITLPLAGAITPERLDNEYQKLRSIFLEQNYDSLPFNEGELEKVMSSLKEKEGFEKTAYRDTENLLTIGFGTNLQAKGSKELLAAAGINSDEIIARENTDTPVVLTDTQSETLLRITTLRALFDCRKSFPGFDSQPENVRKVLIDMMFNMGPESFSTFADFKKCIQARNYRGAADCIKGTKYARQVKGRAVENAEMLRAEASK
ncbi:MAG: hypothetical protein IAF58_09800 [Leptolyngbya sp.]|nr:hypothetical protein [Candidatus Melainabacteria bacterium]